MKKLMSLGLALVLSLGVTACGGGNVEEPSDSVYKNDVQEYITDVLDDTAEITIFEKKSSEMTEDGLTVNCVAIFDGDNGESRGTFELTYSNDGKEWALEKCRVELDEKEISASESEDETIPKETNAEEVVQVADVSDEWTDYTFELDGVCYQLPCSYQTFADNGWHYDQKYSDVQAVTEIAGYSYEYATLTNGSVKIEAYVINMSGNLKQAKDCKIGGISVEAKDNLNLLISKGITCASTKEEIEAAFGVPTNSHTYDNYSSLSYQQDDYQEMSFIVYVDDTTYNSISLRNYVADDNDITVASTERPEYFNSYVAPTSLSDDVSVTQFKLDGVLYQLPCPLEEFINNGWTIVSDYIGTLGAMRDEYGMTIEKDGVKLDLTLANYSDVEVISSNCAVTEIYFSEYSFKDASKDYVVFAGGLTMHSDLDDIKYECDGFDFYESGNYESYTHQDTDYTKMIRYNWYTDEKTMNVSIKNENWDY